MNITYIDSYNNRKRGCNILDDDIYKEYKDSLTHNYYENEKDLFLTRNQERIFITQPVTEIVNDQDEYLDFVYNIPKTCKSDRYNCLPNEKLLNIRNKNI